MARKQKKYYAVFRGRKPGVYNEWYGENGAEFQVKGFPNSLFKGYSSRIEAEVALEQFNQQHPSIPASSESAQPKPDRKSPQSPRSAGSQRVEIYTDGGCLNNPGTGGYGVVIKSGNQRKEISGGFRLTTNNRMELLACIVALTEVKTPSAVTIHSDSQYVVNGINKGWAKRWRKRGWMRTKTEAAENIDLWQRLLDLCEKHQVQFVWVKGHAGNPENECCDRLANKAARAKHLARDEVYEQNRSFLA